MDVSIWFSHYRRAQQILRPCSNNRHKT
jgi:hypothetical protein